MLCANAILCDDQQLHNITLQVVQAMQSAACDGQSRMLQGEAAILRLLC